MTWRRSRADHSGYFALSRSENNVREISQPVKIAQLFGRSGQSQSVKKGSSTKIRLPERIPLSHRSTSKKNEHNPCIKFFHGETNVRRNLDFTKIPTSGEKVNTLSKPSENNPSNMLPTKDLHLSTRKSLLLAPNTIKDWHVKNRLEQSKSILPPQFGISTFDSKSRQSRISDGLEGCLIPVKNTHAHINSVIPEKSNKTSVIQHTSSQIFNINNQSDVQNLNSTDLNFLTTSNENVLEKQIPKSLNCIEMLDDNTFSSQNSSTINQLSSKYDMETKINTDLYNSNNTDQDNIHCVDQSLQTTYTLLDTEQLKDSACSVHVEQEKHLSTTARTCRKDWNLSLQTIKTMSESFAHLRHDTEENNSHVTLSKTELAVLQFNLKHLICRLEEDLSYLKLMSTLIANTLLEANATNKASENNETKIEQLETKNVNNTEEVNNVKTKFPSIGQLVNNLISKTIITKSDNIIEETCKSSDVTSDFLEKDVSRENNSEMQSLHQIDIASEFGKENKEILNTPVNVKRMKPKSETRRRSARLMEKTASKLNVTNDSFVNLEDELNIMNVQSNATPKLLKECIPLANKKDEKDKKVGRPLREYMALKSRMSCLLTPNMKRFNSLESKSDACADTGGTKASLSNKVLAELHNLYADSPET